MADAWAEQTLSTQHLADSPNDREVIETLRSLLQRKTSPQQAAESLAAAYEPLLKSGKTETCNLWGVYCAAITRMGHDRSNLDLLVQTLLSVGRLPDVVDDDRGQPIMENGNVFWREVPEFAFEMSQGPARPIFGRRDKPLDTRALTHATRAAAFGALYLRELDREPKHRRNAPRGPRAGMLGIVLENLHEALGRDSEADVDLRQAHASVPQAAQWILIAGRAIHRAAREGYSNGPDGVLDADVWERWKARFAALARGEGADAELAGLAGEVVGEMRKVEEEER